MKELSIEEKYKKALERAKEIIECSKSDTKEVRMVLSFFPELKECEDKRMIQYFKDLAPFDKAEELYEKYGFSHKDAIAWLEKQGEQKTVDEIAKEVCKNKESAMAFLKSTGIINEKGELADEYKIEQGEQKPADVRTTGYWHVEDVEQKPVWSEEDEKIKEAFVKRILENYNGCSYINGISENVVIDWLKSLKERVQPQPKQEWSEENEKMFEHIIAKATLHFSSINYLDEEEINFLKSLRPQNHWKPSDEQMKALKEAACYSSVFSEKTIDNLISLSKDLKKLKA